MSHILMLAKAAQGKGPLLRFRTVPVGNGTKQHIYYCPETRRRFLLTEEVVDGKRKFTKLRQLEPGRSLLAIEGELTLN